MVDVEQLSDLLARWEEQYEQGIDITPEQLCPDGEDLRERLRREVGERKQILAIINPPSEPAVRGAMVFGALPAIPGYDVLEIIAHGGMGVVYRVKDLELKRVVALKMISRGPFASPDEVARIRIEAQAIARLQHPNIVQIFDVGECEGCPYLALEYLPGGSLGKRLAATPQRAREAAGLVETLARAVHSAHVAGVIHRDLKPSNVLLAADGTPKIGDFGLAKQLDADSGQTHTGQVLGTPSYMSPEQAAGLSRFVGTTTDVYALGAILYEMLTGRPPFKGASATETLDQVRTQEPVAPKRLQPKTPRDLETICLKCLEKDASRRYASADALAGDLKRFLEERPIVARRTGLAARIWRWCKRNPKLSVALAALFVVTVGGVAGITWQWRLARREAGRAEHNLARVFEGVNRWYTKFSGRPELSRAELAPLRKEFLEGARDEFEGMADEIGPNPKFRREFIVATIRASEINGDLGNRDRGSILNRAAVGEGEKFLRDEPNSWEARRTLMAALHSGVIYEIDHERGLGLVRRADELIELWSGSIAPDELDGLRSNQALNANNMAFRLLSIGKNEEALALYRRSCELGEVLIQGKAPPPLAMRGLGFAYSNLCDLEAGANHRDLAERALRRSNDLLKSVLAGNKGKLEAIVEYCRSCEQLGQYLSSWNQLEEATAVKKEVCRLVEEAVDSQRPSHEILELRHRLVFSLHDLQRQHCTNHDAYLETNRDRADLEMKELEHVSRKARALALGLREVLPKDAELDYWAGMSCFNLQKARYYKAGLSEEVDRLLAEACTLLEASLSKRPDEDVRKELQAFKEVRERYSRRRERGR